MLVAYLEENVVPEEGIFKDIYLMKVQFKRNWMG
jgi:hypothetical protein